MTIDRYPIVVHDVPVPLSQDGKDGDEPLDDLSEEKMVKTRTGLKPVKLIRGYPVDEFYQT
jgi:hypothetical protein